MAENSTEKSTSDAVNSNDNIIVIYVIPGSQFSFKVLAALDAYKIPHYVEFVPVSLEERKKVLPSGGTMVPEMRVGTPNNIQAIVPDSEAILHWLDEHRQTNLFPNKIASELSLRASTKTLAGSVWYYNWVNQAGYEASMQKSLAVMFLPKWWVLGRSLAVDWAVSDQRTTHAKLAMQAMGIEDENVLKDEKRVHQMLLEELEYFQSFLKKPSSEQPYLLDHSKEPTAADFSVYAQLERLVGGDSGSSDIHGFPSLKELREKDDDGQLRRLWGWLDLMRERFPVKFKGKRVPPNKM